MRTRFVLSTVVATVLPFALAGCGDKQAAENGKTTAAGHAGMPATKASAHEGKVWMTWPQNGFHVYEDVDFVFGTTEPNGRFALLVNHGPLPAGEKVMGGADVHLLDSGSERHVLKLPVGEQDVTLQLCTADGTSKGPDDAVTATFQVEKTPADLGVWFEEPKDEATVKSPVKVRFGLAGMKLEPAGNADSVPYKTRGHHHLIIDGGPVPVGEPVPADATHIHFGKGQTETTVELSPGKHTLTLQFADAIHQSYGPRMAKTITIQVEP